MQENAEVDKIDSHVYYIVLLNTSCDQLFSYNFKLRKMFPSKINECWKFPLEEQINGLVFI